MQNPRATPELRSPQSLLRDLRQNSIRVERAVAFALVFSTCALVLVIAQGQAAVS